MGRYIVIENLINGLHGIYDRIECIYKFDTFVEIEQARQICIMLNRNEQVYALKRFCHNENMIEEYLEEYLSKTFTRPLEDSIHVIEELNSTKERYGIFFDEMLALYKTTDKITECVPHYFLRKYALDTLQMIQENQFQEMYVKVKSNGQIEIFAKIVNDKICNIETIQYVI